MTRIPFTIELAQRTLDYASRLEQGRGVSVVQIELRESPHGRHLGIVGIALPLRDVLHPRTPFELARSIDGQVGNGQDVSWKIVAPEGQTQIEARADFLASRFEWGMRLHVGSSLKLAALLAPEVQTMILRSRVVDIAFKLQRDLRLYADYVTSNTHWSEAGAAHARQVLAGIQFEQGRLRSAVQAYPQWFSTLPGEIDCTPAISDERPRWRKVAQGITPHAAPLEEWVKIERAAIERDVAGPYERFVEAQVDAQMESLRSPRRLADSVSPEALVRLGGNQILDLDGQPFTFEHSLNLQYHALMDQAWAYVEARTGHPATGEDCFRL